MKKRLTIKKEVKDIILLSLCNYDDNFKTKDPYFPIFRIESGKIIYRTHVGSGKYVISDTDITYEGLEATFRNGTPFWNNNFLELLSGGVWEEESEENHPLSAENAALCNTILDYVATSDHTLHPCEPKITP